MGPDDFGPFFIAEITGGFYFILGRTHGEAKRQAFRKKTGTPEAKKI
jgi:hypothetical protein